MKMKYDKPEIEISVFNTEDIITVSSVTDDGITTSGALSDTTYDDTYKNLFG